jgi:hypothetical protein
MSQSEQRSDYETYYSCRTESVYNSDQSERKDVINVYEDCAGLSSNGDSVHKRYNMSSDRSTKDCVDYSVNDASKHYQTISQTDGEQSDDMEQDNTGEGTCTIQDQAVLRYFTAM